MTSGKIVMLTLLSTVLENSVRTNAVWRIVAAETQYISVLIALPIITVLVYGR